MSIQDNYLKNRKNIFFSQNKDIQNHREKLINIFENDSFDRKNNESLKNINLKNFIDFKYKYLIPEEIFGSTFTVTNPGIFGSLFGMGIINQPNVGILSTGSIHKRPVVKETEFGDVVVIRHMMYLTLGCLIGKPSASLAT